MKIPCENPQGPDSSAARATFKYHEGGRGIASIVFGQGAAKALIIRPWLRGSLPLTIAEIPPAPQPTQKQSTSSAHCRNRLSTENGHCWAWFPRFSPASSVRAGRSIAKSLICCEVQTLGADQDPGLHQATRRIAVHNLLQFVASS